MIGVLIVAAVTVGIIGFVGGGVFLVGREYDRHPWVKAFLDAQARMRYIPPPDSDISQEYLNEVPGWDEIGHSSK